MTTMPNELATKRPANSQIRRHRHTAGEKQTRTIDGQFRAVRGGPSLTAVLTWLITVMLAAGFAGYLLSTF
ncbi:hypothetical protein [Actinoplanes sp. URMC 104]|uniref:hypothetical protein n=1 Tax=Actinoplanes sp. URMC 104 TaxID=3423409 RepID=UPI003F1AD7E1